MAKKSNNQFILLALGGLVLLGLIVLSYLSLSAVQSDFVLKKGRSAQGKGLQGEELIAAALTKLNSPPQWSGEMQDGRKLRLFTSVPLFTKPGQFDPIDLFDEGSQDVHQGIPNSWWLENQVDPGFVNSPQRDEDGDGFSNEEEFAAQTDPQEATSFPELGPKLVVRGSSVLKWKLLFSSEIGADQYQFKYQNTKRAKLRTDYIAEGDRFFASDPVENRFILTSVREEDQEKRGVITKVKIATIQDTQKDTEIKIPRASRNNFVGLDYTLELSLNALGKAGESFSISENQRFNLPEGEVSAGGRYHFEKVINGASALVTWLENGEKRQISLPIK